MPISADYKGEGEFESPGIDFPDYGRMYSFDHKLEAHRRLDTPPWALRQDLLRAVIVHFVERRAQFKKPLPGTERERLARASQRNAERCKFKEEVLRNLCVEFVALKKSGADPARTKKLSQEISNLDTCLRIDKTVAGIAVSIVNLYYGVGLDSVAVASELGIKPPHVRALLWKLNWVANKLQGTAKPRLRHRYPDRIVAKRIARMAEKGISYTIIAKKFGVSRTQICRRLTEAGLWKPRQVGRKPKIDANVDKYARMAATGISYSLIAKKFGISSVQVRRRLKQAGLWKARLIQPTVARLPHQKGRLTYLQHQQFNADIAIGLYLAGKSVPEIARSFGYAPNTGQNRVRYALIKAGVYVRKQS